MILRGFIKHPWYYLSLLSPSSILTSLSPSLLKPPPCLDKEAYLMKAVTLR